MFIQELYAMGQAPGPGQPAQSPIVSLLPMLLIFVIFYFILIRPQQKKAKEQSRLLDNIKKNDRVLLSSGIIGIVQNIRGNIVDLRVDDNVKIQVLKSTVSKILTQDELTKESTEGK